MARQERSGAAAAGSVSVGFFFSLVRVVGRVGGLFSRAVGLFGRAVRIVCRVLFGVGSLRYLHVTTAPDEQHGRQHR